MSKTDHLSVPQKFLPTDDEGYRLSGWTAQVLLLCLALSAFAFAQSLSPIVANQNHVPAGVLRDGILSVHLEIAKGEWHPEADDFKYSFGCSLPVPETGYRSIAVLVPTGDRLLALEEANQEASLCHNGICPFSAITFTLLEGINCLLLLFCYENRTNVAIAQ
jgi:hypothetical protein